MEKQIDKEIKLILNICLTAGRIMMENGSEVYRTEEMMERIAANAGYKDSVSHVTVTGIFMGFKSLPYTQLENIRERRINLQKVATVNQLSREFEQKKISIEKLQKNLNEIDFNTPTFSIPLQILSAGIVSCTLMYIFGGSWKDFIPTFFIGMAGFSASFVINKFLKLKFFDDFIAAFLIGFLAYLSVKLNLAGNMDHIIIGSVMPLVPGVAITNAFRDILAGHLISGMARATEAIFVAGSIGIGISMIFILFL
ncbi:threonine/serine exporter family protein [Enterococcus sp. CWB-B31]|uniref:threonine/serine exporter family protein n=1 Tax=Enterococcus sp. CWB-B31 TaxID=2885159 RepID=UPI001E3909A1|nr:threonine/serine exporter family protein [Enterococcus sp. CWB-B31]MCB5955289.1 threonine/serine exporter family protein [Enterococcus sp. CWB-B31]